METDENNGNKASSVELGKYTFIAQVSLTMRSRNSWYLSTDLYYEGEKMDYLEINARTSVSVNGKYYNVQDFTQDRQGRYTSFGTYYIGTTVYQFQGDNTFGSFNLNIHAGAAIVTFWGTNPGSNSLNVVVPFTR